MPDDDAGDALRRSLGLKPRTASSSAGAAAADPAASAASTAATTSSRATGLGIRRRTQSSASGGTLQTTAEPLNEPITDPVKKPVGKLGTDAARLLRQYYMSRPEIDLPPFVLELPGTHGWYMGDGRDERPIVVGFTPAFVLYTLPLFPDGQPEWVKGEFLMPGLPSQPEYTETGFLAPLRVNLVNSMATYIVWQSPVPLSAKPAVTSTEGVPADESPRDRRRREEMDKRKRDLDARKARNETRTRR